MGFEAIDVYQHRRHNKNLLIVHIIFVTKYRKSLLNGDFSNDVKQYIFDSRKRHHWYLKKMETNKDHIHLLLQYSPSDRLSSIVSILKQESTYNAWQHYGGSLRQHYWAGYVLYGQADILLAA